MLMLFVVSSLALTACNETTKLALSGGAGYKHISVKLDTGKALSKGGTLKPDIGLVKAVIAHNRKCAQDPACIKPNDGLTNNSP